MKKLTAIFAVLILATTIKVNAQGAGKVSVHDISITKNHITKVGPGQLILAGANLKEGTNSIQTKELTGTLVLVMSGDSFSEVIFKDASGKSTRLTPTHGGTHGAPNPPCKTKLPDACFSSSDKNIGMCICKPGNISNGEGGYTISVYQRTTLTIPN